MSDDQDELILTGDEEWDRSGDKDWDTVMCFQDGVVAEEPCLLTSDPIDGSFSTYSPFQVIHLSPGETRTFHANGPPGARVNISSSRYENSGGHSHSGGPNLKIAPSSFTLGGRYPQNAPWRVTAPEASGVFELVGKFSSGNPGTHRFRVVVALDGLVRLSGSSSIVLTGATSTHPNNHYGTPGFVSKIEQLGNKFKTKFNKPIYVNDMSLIHGGLFDIKGDWKSPHATHRRGTNADINSRSMTEDEKKFFRSTASALGLNAVEHGKPLHWHVSG